MVAWAPIVGAGIAASGLLSDGGGGNSAALLAEARAEFERLRGRAPTAEEMQAQMQQYVEAGMISPEEAQTVLMGPSAYEGIKVDPAARQAQSDALRQLSDITEGGGLTAIDKSKISNIQDEIDTSNRGAQGAIVQNAAERGVGGSGLDLAARLSAQQGAATTGAKRSTDVAALAQQRALDTIAAKANLGGSMRTQDFGEASTKAAARDAIEKFNTTNRQAVINANADRVARSRELNFANKQDVSNKNVTTANTNAVRNGDLKQQVFSNDLAVTQGIAGQDNTAAAAEEAERKRKDAIRNSMIGAGGTIMAGG